MPSVPLSEIKAYMLVNIPIGIKWVVFAAVDFIYSIIVHISNPNGKSASNPVQYMHLPGPGSWINRVFEPGQPGPSGYLVFPVQPVFA